MASILKTIAQDINRSLLHGARRADANNKVRPSTVLDGRQSDTTAKQLKKGIRLSLKEGAISLDLVPDAKNVDDTDKAVNEALGKSGDYFKLEPERQLPVWICHQKLFSLPAQPAREAVVTYDQDGTAMKLLRLPPSILHENARHRIAVDNPQPAPAEISLCKVVEEPRRNGHIQKLLPLAIKEWRPAILVRCPMNPVWKDGSTKEAVFELASVPQDERWYLDQLGLLPPTTSGDELLKGAELKIWIELPAKAGDTPQRIQAKQWVLARKNLTALARPGESQLMDGAEEPVPYPYAVTEADKVNTLRLVQMGSITNSGGYYFRSHGSEDTFTHETHTLVVALLFPKKDEQAAKQVLPQAANAVAFPTQADAVKEPGVVRFEGDQHLVIEPYTPMGCVAFGWRRHLPAATKEGLNPDHPEGYARQIHLLDYEIRNTGGDILEQYLQTVENGKEPCAGGAVGALSPVKRLRNQDEKNNANAIPVLAIDDAPDDVPDAPDDSPPIPDNYFYRHTVRLVPDSEGYSYIADAKKNKVVIRAGYRDIFGNRLLRDQAEQSLQLCYGDALVPPGEWPGFVFQMLPTAAGTVTLKIFYRPAKGEAKSAGDWAAKLRRIKAQMKGAAGDVSAILADASGVADPAKSIFAFQPADAKSLLEALNSMLEKAESKTDDSQEGELTFTVQFRDVDGSRNRPCLFAPQIVIRRTESKYLPDFDALLGDAPSFVKAEIRDQMILSQTAVPLQLTASEPTPGASVSVQLPSFRDVAQKYADLLAPGMDAVAAARRNRFNDHELWFVPIGLFPTVRNGDPVFGTPRPLSNRLGAETFDTPDFFGEKAEKWQQLKKKNVGATRVDFDLQGRRAFALVDELAQPLDLTGRLFAEGMEGTLLWNEIMGAKDQVAQYLGDASSGYLVPLFKGDKLAAGGITRMCRDAFQRNLQFFYGIDTLVQWPVSIPVELTGAAITNFYGTSEAEFTDKAGLPKYSDFVLSTSEDREPATDAPANGFLTVTYDLPPDRETDFEMWQTTTYTARITHLQLPMGDVLERNVFNQGQWLELVRVSPGVPESGGGVLKYTPNNLKVPAILRRFPAEPILASCSTLSPQGQGLKPEGLSTWGWEVTFDVQNPNNQDAKNSADTVHLEVEYADLERVANDVMDEAADGWPSTSLLQDLEVLGQLAIQPLNWWNDATHSGPLALQALPYILKALLKHLQSPNNGVQSDDVAPASRVDRFVLELSKLKETPSDVPGESGNKYLNKVAAQLDKFDENEAHSPNMLRYKVEAPVDGSSSFKGPLNMFVGDTATAFKPNLRLKRNEKLLGKAPQDCLVYECGPVYYPELVRVANRISDPVLGGILPAAEFSKEKLEALVAGTLTQVLGGTLGNHYELRVDCKHSFKAGNFRLTNAFKILPQDFKYTTMADLANTLAGLYLEFLGKDHAADALKVIAEPAFVVGVQVMSVRDKHVMLEIDQLRFEFP